MLRTLRRLLGRADPDQLTLPLERPANTPRRRRAANNEAADRLLGRLRAYGLVRITRCRLTRNRNVMVSFSGGEVRVHEGYLDAPDEVLRAIVVFVEGRTRAERRAAQRTIVSHPIRTVTSRARVERTRPEDRGSCEKLARWHARLNARHFHGRLKPVAIRISRRMHSRLGHYTAASQGDPAEIAISWRHLRRHGWQEALHTLLHEMVHQWQDETGHTIDHGAAFRAKAREVGIAPAARRSLTRGQGHSPGEQRIGRRAAREE